MRSGRGKARRPSVLVMLTVLLTLAHRSAAAQMVPDRLTDSTFWQMMTGMSEPNGYFQSENLLSNETGFETVIPALLGHVTPGAVYLGVGPEQNFTYIAALHPPLAFIVDIRHQNAMQHLLYKALMELSDSRVDFVSRLFSRPRPAELRDDVSVDTLLAVFDRVAPDSMLYHRTLDAVEQRLIGTHGFPLDSSERQLLEHNFTAFYQAGPELSYAFNSNRYGGRGRMPDYAELMVQTDAQGVERSYLATPANYAVVRDLELRNLIVPLTGDFSGPHALRAIGDYLRAHGAVVGAFYTSNVEQYLFRQDDEASRFYANVATLPIDSGSTFIRSGGGGFRGHGGPGGMHASLLEPIADLLAAFKAGQITQYADVLQRSH